MPIHQSSESSGEWGKLNKKVYKRLAWSILLIPTVLYISYPFVLLIFPLI